MEHDRPALEIEITKDMLEKGRRKLATFDERFTSYEDGVCQIIEAVFADGQLKVGYR